MATVTGLTAARMLEIEAESVVDGDVVSNNLILTKHDGSTIDAGNVRGPTGSTGPTGDTGPAGVQGPPGSVNAIYSDIWSWTTSLTVASSLGQVGLNAASWAAATQINMNEQTKDGRNVSVLAFPRINIGDQLYIQHKTDPTRYAYYTVSGAPVDNGTWWAFPVTFDRGGGTPPPINVDTNISLMKAGAGSVPVQDEGTLLTARSKLNFIGAAVAATDDGANDRTNVTLTAVQSSDLLPGSLANTANSPNTQAASYTLVLSDANKAIEANSASAITFTVPPNSSVAFPIGTLIEISRYGAGSVTIAAGAGVTIRSRSSLLSISNQYSAASLRKRATDEWVLVGDLA